MDINALIIEQKKEDAELMIHHLEAADFYVNSLIIDTTELFEKALKNNQWDVIIIGDVSSNFNLLSAIKILDRSNSNVPVILVNTTLSENIAISVLRMGSDEFRNKDPLLPLASVIQREINFRQDHHAQEHEANKKFEIKQNQQKKSNNDEDQQSLNNEDVIHHEDNLFHYFDSIADGFLIIDTHGRIIKANNAVTQLTGYSIKELSGINVLDLDPNLNAEHAKFYVQQAFRNGSVRFETTNIKKDGSLLDVEITLTLLSESNDRIICFYRDISERKTTERAIEEHLEEIKYPDIYDEDIKFEDLFNLDMIQNIQDEFSAATGVASIITRPDGTPITRQSNFCHLCNEIIRKTEKGKLNCYQSDAEIGKYNPGGPIVQPCMSGELWDAGAGIIVNDKQIANWMIGQVRDETQSEERIREYAREIGADEDKAATAFAQVKIMSKTQFEHVAKALYIIANQLSTIAYQNIQQGRFIAKQKAAKKALLESENRYKAFFDYGPDATIIIDPFTGKFLQFNERAYMSLGYTKEEFEILGMADIDAIHSEEEIATRFQDINKTGYQAFSSRHKTKTGEIREVHVIVQLIEMMGTPIHLCIWRDITEQRVIEEALKDSEEQLSLALIMGNAGVWIWNLDMQTLFFDAQFANMLGYKHEELTVVPGEWRTFLHPDDIMPTLSKLEDYLHGSSTSFEAEFRFRTAEKEWAWIIVRGKTLRKKNDQASTQLIGIAMNIDDKKNTEKKLADYQEHLEELVESRTAELQRMNDELEAFSYSVSHDLRAPLRSINGFSSILFDDYQDSLDESGLHYLSIIQDSSRKMGHLIEDLLNLSRISRREILKSKVNLSELAQIISIDVLSQFPDRNIEVVIKPDIFAWADRNLMKIMLENLFINAYKFTAKKDKAIISFGKKEEEGKSIYYIKDNGAGFDISYAEKLFVPFQRLHSSDEYKGTGIGLSIVKRIISRHNGQIWVEAEVDHGATFYFTLCEGKILEPLDSTV
jgi:PAS domain S-box-containing protein